MLNTPFNQAEQELLPLSLGGCAVPATAHALARITRSEVFSTFWSLAAANEAQQQALIVACNFYPEAAWWVNHRHDARIRIADAVTVLCRLRREASPAGARDTGA